MGVLGWVVPILPCLQNASAGVERLLIGNKCDMESKRKVQREEAEKVGGSTVGWGTLWALGLPFLAPR